MVQIIQCIVHAIESDIMIKLPLIRHKAMVLISCIRIIKNTAAQQKCNRAVSHTPSPPPQLPPCNLNPDHKPYTPKLNEECEVKGRENSGTENSITCSVDTLNGKSYKLH